MLYGKIRELCQQRGIAITALEKELGFGRGSIGKLQKGSNTNSERIAKIANYFGVTTDYLMGIDTSPSWYLDPEVARIAQETYDDPTKRALHDASRGCRPEDVQMAIDLLMRLKRTNPDG